MREQKVTSRPWLRIAAEMWWENPKVTQQVIADAVNLSRKAVNEAFQDEAWEVERLQVIQEHMPRLIPLAWRALEKQWANGNAAGALDLLRSVGLVKPVEIHHTFNEAEVDREIERVLARLGAAGEGGIPQPAGNANGMAPNGASSPAEL